ncbi:MAG: nucleoside hydrolase [Alphaproteobacteria bacterium]
MKTAYAWSVGGARGLARSLALCASAAAQLGALAALVLLVPWASAPAARAGGTAPVWIDTDAACGEGGAADVDDCWALALALASPELEVRGIGTVFGNVDMALAHGVARAVLDRVATGAPPPLFAGAVDPATPFEANAAARALARALERERLVVVALGPLTNLAAVLDRRPELAGRIERVIAVLGQRPGQRFFPGASRLLHFHDLNLRKDPDAVAGVLASGVPLVLLPFEAATKVTIGPRDLNRLADSGPRGASLADRSRAWLAYWRDWLGTEGFHPFDSLAVGYAVRPELFGCESLPARLERRPSLLFQRSSLEVAREVADGRVVTYCTGVGPRFKDELLGRLEDTEWRGAGAQGSDSTAPARHAGRWPGAGPAPER